MKPMTLNELDDLLTKDPEYVAAERELRPDLNLAGEIIALRVEAGWSQADLAAQVGTNQANISRLESALANPTLRFLKKVAWALGADLDVRLRKQEDTPGTDTVESFIGEPTLVVRTGAVQHKASMSWQAPALTQVIYEASANSSVSCEG